MLDTTPVSAGIEFTWGVTGDYTLTITANVGNGNYVIYEVVVTATITP